MLSGVGFDHQPRPLSGRAQTAHELPLAEQLELSRRNSVFRASNPARCFSDSTSTPTPHSTLPVNHVAALKSLVGALVMAMSTAFGSEGAVFQTPASAGFSRKNPLPSHLTYLN